MGYKVEDFQTKRSVNECQVGFRSGITSGRGASALIGGFTAKMMGGESLSWAGPGEVEAILRANPELADMHSDPPAATMGVAVPKAYGAHTNGTMILALIWDRGLSREVRLLAEHSLTGGSHALKLLAAAKSAMST